MAVTLYASNEGFMDDIDVTRILPFETELHQYMHHKHADLMSKIETTKDRTRMPRPNSRPRLPSSRSPGPDHEPLTGSDHGRQSRDTQQDQERSEHAQDHQGHGDGGRIQDAQGAGTHARRRPYSEKIRRLAANLSQANVTEYRHAFLGRAKAAVVKRVGLIVVTTDKGLCGGLNTNILRQALNTLRQWEADGANDIRVTCIGNKGLGSCSALAPMSFRM